MIKAVFFNGENASSEQVVLYPEGQSILIRIPGKSAEHRFKIEEIRVEHFSGGKIRLLHGKAQLVLNDFEAKKFKEAFPELSKKGSFERKKIPIYLGAVAASIIMIFWVIQSLSQFLPGLITVNHEKVIFSGLIQGLKKSDCSTKNQKDLLWKVMKKIDDDKVIEDIILIKTDIPNAFAYPGGMIAFTTGFFKFVKSDEELLGVMAHELQHVKQRHHLKGFLKTGVISLIFQGITGGMDSSVINIMETLTSSRYQQSDEKQADIEAAELLQSKGLSVVGLSTFFERLSMKNKDSFKLFEQLLSSHPTDEKRVEYLKPYQDLSSTHISILNSVEWKSLKAACL